MKISDARLGFIGFGHMAQIIFKAIAQAKLIPRSQVSFIRRDTEKMRKNEQEFGITAATLETIAETSDILILGVRPAQAGALLRDLKRCRVGSSKPIISMLAGVKLSYYQKIFDNPILRIMPNLASEVAMGMTVLSYSPNPPLAFRSLSNLLFSCMGEAIEVPEAMMDVCCGIAGSGPGFVFRLIEAMARIGEKEGLSYAKALKMAAQTFAGAAKLVLKTGDPQTLLRQIATPNGTTEAGLKMMTALHVDEHLQNVVSASARRSKELSEEFQ
ncbi:MAG: pyrroline-5-carboxylate reductase [Chlamydiales bacterium]